MFARGSQVPIAALAKDVWHNAGSFLLGEAERGCDGGGALPVSPMPLVLPEGPGGGILADTVPSAETQTPSNLPQWAAGVCVGSASPALGWDLLFEVWL